MPPGKKGKSEELKNALLEVTATTDHVFFFVTDNNDKPLLVILS